MKRDLGRPAAMAAPPPFFCIRIRQATFGKFPRPAACEARSNPSVFALYAASACNSLPWPGSPPSTEKKDGTVTLGINHKIWATRKKALEISRT